jgi:hypothetical protein
MMGALLALAHTAADGSRALAKVPSDAVRAPNECIALSVTSPQAAARQRSSFSATRILDLRFTSEMRRRLTGDHVLDFRVYTPRGQLYQTLTTPFTGSKRRPRDRRIDGHPRAVREQPQSVTDGTRRYAVSATLPVGGTAIMSSSLYGRWRVETFLDGAPRPCGNSAHFEIQP